MKNFCPQVVKNLPPILNANDYRQNVVLFDVIALITRTQFYQPSLSLHLTLKFIHFLASMWFLLMRRCYKQDSRALTHMQQKNSYRIINKSIRLFVNEHKVSPRDVWKDLFDAFKQKHSKTFLYIIVLLKIIDLSCTITSNLNQSFVYSVRVLSRQMALWLFAWFVFHLPLTHHP